MCKNMFPVWTALALRNGPFSTSTSSSRSKNPLTKFLFHMEALPCCNLVTFSSISYTELNCLTINNVFQAFNHLRVFFSGFLKVRGTAVAFIPCSNSAKCGQELPLPQERNALNLYPWCHTLPPPRRDAALHTSQDAAWHPTFPSTQPSIKFTDSAGGSVPAAHLSQQPALWFS